MWLGNVGLRAAQGMNAYAGWVQTQGSLTIGSNAGEHGLICGEEEGEPGRPSPSSGDLSLKRSREEIDIIYAVMLL